MKKLFDLKFEHLISKAAIQVLYVTSLVILTIGSAYGIYTCIQELLVLFRPRFLFAIIGIITGYFLILVLIRLVLEDRLVKYQMAEDIKEIRKKL